MGKEEAEQEDWRKSSRNNFSKGKGIPVKDARDDETTRIDVNRVLERQISFVSP